MIDTNALKAEWVKKGLRQKDVANILKVTPKTLYTKLKKGVLGSDEIETLIVKLDIEKPMDIFFKSE
ncbi:MAG: DUF739 domain-containing protein [Monoglobales bacterium]|jgi:DNA-binding NtrC family response regulator|nr:MAG TPA: antitoxin [Caudoviricetes sp.]